MRACGRRKRALLEGSIRYGEVQNRSAARSLLPRAPPAFDDARVEPVSRGFGLHRPDKQPGPGRHRTGTGVPRRRSPSLPGSCASNSQNSGVTGDHWPGTGRYLGVAEANNDHRPSTPASTDSQAPPRSRDDHLRCRAAGRQEARAPRRATMACPLRRIEATCGTPPSSRFFSASRVPVGREISRPGVTRSLTSCRWVGRRCCSVHLKQD